MPKAIWRSEKGNFQPELWRSIKHILLWTKYRYHKIPDLWTKNRYDCFLQLPWKRYLAMELKINKHPTLLQFGQFFKWREHELEELSLDFNLWNEAWILVNCYYPRKHNYVLLFSILQWHAIIKLYAPKKSCKLDDPSLMKYCKFIDQKLVHPDWKKDSHIWDLEEPLNLKL